MFLSNLCNILRQGCPYWSIQLARTRIGGTDSSTLAGPHQDEDWHRNLKHCCIYLASPVANLALDIFMHIQPVLSL